MAIKNLFYVTFYEILISSWNISSEQEFLAQIIRDVLLLERVETLSNLCSWYDNDSDEFSSLYNPLLEVPVSNLSYFFKIS